MIYGSVPHTLRGAYRYHQAAYVDENVAQGSRTTGSFFEIAKKREDMAHVSINIKAPLSGGNPINYVAHLQVRTDEEDDTAWRTVRVFNQDSPPNTGYDYIDPRQQLSVLVVTAAAPLRITLRQS